MTQIFVKPFHAYVIVITTRALKTTTAYHLYSSQTIHPQHLLRSRSAESWVNIIKFFQQHFGCGTCSIDKLFI